MFFGGFLVDLNTAKEKEMDTYNSTLLLLAAARKRDYIYK